jgi:hypothetical protein
MDLQPIRPWVLDFIFPAINWIADACALADLQDQVAEAEAVELMTEEDER